MNRSGRNDRLWLETMSPYLSSRTNVRDLKAFSLRSKQGFLVEPALSHDKVLKMTLLLLGFTISDCEFMNINYCFIMSTFA